MSDNEMLYCLIAFILGWLIARMMGEGFSVGASSHESCVFNQKKWDRHVTDGRMEDDNGELRAACVNTSVPNCEEVNNGYNSSYCGVCLVYGREDMLDDLQI